MSPARSSHFDDDAPSTRVRGAVVVPRDGRKPFGAHWCNWCEDVHTFGLGEVPGSKAVGSVFYRSAKCSETRSPLAHGGVTVEIARLVRDFAAIEPPGPFVPHHGAEDREPLRELLVGRELEAVVARFIFDQPPTATHFGPGRKFEVALFGGSATFEDGGYWTLRNDEGEPIDAGEGLLSLLARLFGVSSGVAFVRLCEAIIGNELPSEARLTIAAAIDATQPTDWLGGDE